MVEPGPLDEFEVPDESDRPCEPRPVHGPNHPARALRPDDDLDPLEVTPIPVAISYYDPDVSGAATVRLFFYGGGAQPPHVDIADVVILEAPETVSIALVRRLVEGDAPDGTSYGMSLSKGQLLCLDVPLDEPLGTRELIDAWGGYEIARIDRSPGTSIQAEQVGAPLWRRR
jgi:hypothetical protein